MVPKVVDLFHGGFRNDGLELLLVKLEPIAAAPSLPAPLIEIHYPTLVDPSRTLA